MLWAGFSGFPTLRVLWGTGCGCGKEEPGGKDVLTVCSTAQNAGCRTPVWLVYPSGTCFQTGQKWDMGKRGQRNGSDHQDPGRGKSILREACSRGECPASPRSGWCLCLILVSILNLHHIDLISSVHPRATETTPLPGSCWIKHCLSVPRSEVSPKALGGVRLPCLQRQLFGAPFADHQGREGTFLLWFRLGS